MHMFEVFRLPFHLGCLDRLQIQHEEKGFIVSASSNMAVLASIWGALFFLVTFKLPFHALSLLSPHPASFRSFTPGASSLISFFCPSWYQISTMSFYTSCVFLLLLLLVPVIVVVVVAVVVVVCLLLVFPSCQKPSANQAIQVAEVETTMSDEELVVAKARLEAFRAAQLELQEAMAVRKPATLGRNVGEDGALLKGLKNARYIQVSSSGLHELDAPFGGNCERISLLQTISVDVWSVSEHSQAPKGASQCSVHSGRGKRKMGHGWTGIDSQDQSS